MANDQLNLSPVSLTEEERASFDYRLMDNDAGRCALKLVRQQSSAALERMLNDEAMREQLRLALGPRTNPSWVEARIASELYDRGVIDEQQFDALTR